MALFRNLRSMFSPTVIHVYGGDMGVAVANMDAAELYRTQPNLRAVVSFLADNAAQVPLKVHERRSDSDRPRVLDSPGALLLAQPNPDMTAFEYKRWVYSDLLLYERHLSLLVPSADTDSGWELRPVPGLWIRGYNGQSPYAPESIDVGAPNAAPVEVPAGKFVLFHGYDPTDPMRQFSRISALKDTLHEQVESNSFRRQMWKRGGRFNAYLTRPKDVQPWTDGAFARFKETWKASWAGAEADEGGGMPILEDGMEIKTVQFNSRDAQWAESVKLSREDAAAVYHVNPAMIWPGSGQTYASAKDNARSLYNDTLAPQLMQVTDRLTADVLKRIGEPSGHYVAYDITIKTEGTFEEKISALQSAVGAPFLSRNEARAKLDLPAIEGGDELIVPLNVMVGGLASNHDTDPTVERYNSAAATVKAEVVDGPKAPDGEPERKAKGDPAEGAADELAEVYRAFFERQRKSVVPKIESGAANWWNAERWDSELVDDLYPVALRQADAAGERAVAQLWPDDASRKYGKEQTAAYISKMCLMRAQAVNAVTHRELQDAIDEGGKAAAVDAKGLRSTIGGVFANAILNRSRTTAGALACALVGFATMEGVKQNKRRGENVYKTWRTTSGNPRSSHRAINGETVQYDQPFSNGMMWPGDWKNGSAAEVAFCKCVLDVEVREIDSYVGRIRDRYDIPAQQVVAADLTKVLGGLDGCSQELYEDAWIGMQELDVPRRKIEDWSLKDKDKARAFREYLGYEREDHRIVRFQTFARAWKVEPVPKGENAWGKLYQRDFIMDGKDGRQANVRTGWILRTDTDKMQLTSEYVKE